ncbi:Rpn family recombination-promoting nuclease/putative transposase [Desulfallas sp. Bu1-1]|uniref:Rpn family recombination-promoting nuclease/putative transposase n=1 Tax=Desulfallas sp. Bu1-1 TaxID=2787620 RepID=UPI0018A03FF8|nr:Rpn family recombination-promoting nuclease/putative transposase [Desulfallas sp. Bu1-1]MBF7084426.1 Rpn family recombination-promoting nuclease/putative transposase [Desulfallas sp. Bu1-1]
MPENEQPARLPYHPHDKGYKQLLSNKRVFLELIKTFVREEWAGEIEEKDLVLVNKSYMLKDFTEKEADIIYRLKTKNVIFYILLELQSTVDYLMPFRLLQYMVEIWREIYHNTPEKERERKTWRLPAIIQAVLYNGANNWTAAVHFKEMLAGYRQFEKNILDFKYILFDVNRYREEELYRAANLIASVFVLDQKMDPAEITKRLRKLAGALSKMSGDEFRQLAVWLKNVIMPKIPGHLQPELGRILDENNPWEVEIMITNLEITLEEMQQRAKMEGKAEGIKEGKAEGIKEGEMKKAMETAKAALKKGFSVEDIMEITGLSRETVLKIKNQLN